MMKHLKGKAGCLQNVIDSTDEVMQMCIIFNRQHTTGGYRLRNGMHWLTPSCPAIEMFRQHML